MTRARRLLRRIARRHAFLAELAHRVEVIADDDVAAAAIDTAALRIALRPAWCAELDDDELEYVLLHELMHAFLRTTPRGRGLDALYWNFAHDLVINQRLTEMTGRPAPDGGVTLDPVERIDAETAYLRIQDDRYRDQLRAWTANHRQIDLHDGASPSLANAKAGQQGVSLGRGGQCLAYSACDYDAAEAADPCSAVIELAPVRPWPSDWLSRVRASGAIRGRSWLRPSRRQADDALTAGRYRVTGEVVALVDVTPAMLVHARRMLGQLRAFLADLGAPGARIVSVDETGVVGDARVDDLPQLALPRALVNHRTEGASRRDGLWVCRGCQRPHAAPRPCEAPPAFARVDPALRAASIVIAAPARTISARG